MRRKADHRHRGIATSGFTLIELLVVISIIALLLSLLLPSMSGARRTGQRVACAAGLRRVAEGMGQYAQDNEDWIIGSPQGSGAYLVGQTNAYGPAVHLWDFMGPMAQLWGFGISLPTKNDTATWAKRFDELRSNGAFLCPSNRFLAWKFAGPNESGTGWMISYNTCRYQLWATNDKQNWSEHGVFLPRDYKPILSRVGPPADKIFCGDGARWTTSAADGGPDFDLGFYSVDRYYGFGGPCSDTGAHSSFSRSWDRTRAPGNGTADRDARLFAYRHATGDPPTGAPGNAYKGNFAFYDGHVETQGDLDSANPHQWIPAGSTLESDELWPDAKARYAPGGGTINIGVQ